MNLTRRHAVLGGIALLIAVAAALSVVIFVFASMHGQLEVSHKDHVWVHDPVTIHFDQAVDTSQVQINIEPHTTVSLKRQSQDLVITPNPAWLPGRHYTISLADLANARHTTVLRGWHGNFQTQPNVAVSAFKAAGHQVSNDAAIRLRAALTIGFSVAMKPSTVAMTVNGLPATAADLIWSDGDTVATLSAAHGLPAQPLEVAVSKGFSADGDPLVAPAAIKVTRLGLEPSNTTSGIGADFTTLAPLQIVIENSGPARPQQGLQQADIVYEYISEYSIGRMTAMYFNNPPNIQIGPVRSCRLINPPLNFAFHGLTMCSGASVGTLHFMFSLRVPAIINDFDYRDHFMRVGFKYAPHNLYTDGGRALRFRREDPLPTPPYTIDPVHPDNDLGVPSAVPSVPLHAVTYSYDAGRKEYLRFDHGTPFVDASTKAQLHVKNVILIHTPYEVQNYVEDESGGARSVRYFRYNVDEQGAAEIYSDGKLLNATWHMGWTTPMYFTDAQGNFIELNSGLTWIHVLGDGQTS